MKKKTQEEWIKEAMSVLISRGGWTEQQARNFAEALCDPECNYYEEGYSPEQAVVEDLSNA